MVVIRNAQFFLLLLQLNAAEVDPCIEAVNYKRQLHEVFTAVHNKADLIEETLVLPEQLEATE